MIRVLLVAAALLGAAWLAVEERGARAADRITALALAGRGEAAVREARALEPAATRLTPDTQPRLDVGIAESRAGRHREAGARFAAVARAEPENLRAWTLLCLVAPRYDSGSAATACARARALAPPVPPVR